jgi:hypothetical protein
MDWNSLFEAVARGELSPEAAAARAESEADSETIQDLGFALVDHDRATRCGFPEVVFGAGKTPGQTVRIAEAVVARSGRCLVTRVTEEAAQALGAAFPDAERNAVARTVAIGLSGAPEAVAKPVCVVSAGTSDLPVAEEAAVTARAMGCPVERVDDAGVAGLHRILSRAETLRRAAAVVVVAGMEGALPSVVGGLVATPVIAVPTSVGYGASFGGLAALLGMLNSCASGVAVVNIDNGFGGGFVAARIARNR